MTKASRKPAPPIEGPPLPEPTQAEIESIAAARAKLATRHRPVSANFEPEANVARLMNPHADGRGWSDQMQAASGSASPVFADKIVADAINALKLHGGPASVDEVNVALAVLDGSEPESELEAMLIAQALATYTAANEMVRRTVCAGQIDHLQAYGNIATKLQRTFVAQVEALAKLRRGGEQIVKVVHVHPGGQAVVGDVNVNQAAREGAHRKNEEQPHEIADAPVLSLLGQDTARNPVSVASHAERSLPATRRTVTRRTKRST